MPVITLFTIQEQAIAFAARIHVTAAPEDRKAIAKYGGCLIMEAHIGAVTLANFAAAMHNCWTPEYEEFSSYLFENEIALLNDNIARVVARLEAPFGGMR